MLTNINQFDYTLSLWATQITQGSTLMRVLVYLVAEILIFVFPAYLYYLWRSGGKGAKKVALIALLSMVLGIFCRTVINVCYFRERPFISHPELSTFSFHVDPSSFPSGHAIFVFSIAVSILLSGYKKAGKVLISLALLIALARCFAGVHYFSDVTVGALIGLVSAVYLHREASTLKKYLPNE